MNKDEIAAVIVSAVLSELMEVYDKTRSEWIQKFGSDAGFDIWFTRQVLKKMK